MRNAFASFVVTLTVLGAPALAHAEEQYRIEFDAAGLPNLSLDGSTPTPGSAGRWLGSNEIDGRISSFPGSNALPVSGDVGAPFSSGLLRTYLNVPAGQPYVEVWYGASGGEGVGGLGVAARNPSGGERLGGISSWSRGFELLPHSSVTLSGTWRLEASGDGVTPVDFFTDANFSIDSSLGAAFGRFEIADPSHGLRGVVQGSLSGFLSDDITANPFSYTLDESGRIAYTVTNFTDRVLTGNVSTVAYLNMSAVPEPAMVGSLLAGLGLLGALAGVRRRGLGATGKAGLSA